MSSDPQLRTARGTTVVIVVGRNAGAEPMADGRWKEFRSDAGDALVSAGAEIVFAGHGLGTYDGAAEESFVWCAALPAGFNPVGLRRHLSIVAAAYEQEGIAMVVGRGELVAPVQMAVAGEQEATGNGAQRPPGRLR